MSAPSNIYHTASKLTDRRIPAPSVTASRTITQFWVFFFCECVYWISSGSHSRHLFPPTSSFVPLHLGRKLRSHSLLLRPCPPLVARQRPEESETPRRAAVSVAMATAWVIQVEVRENSLFFFSLSLSLSLPAPPSSSSSLPPSSLPLLSNAFILPPFHFLCLCANCLPFFFFFSPSHPLLFRFSVMLIRERITEKEWRRIDLSLSLAHTHTHTLQHTLIWS